MTVTKNQRVSEEDRSFQTSSSTATSSSSSTSPKPSRKSKKFKEQEKAKKIGMYNTLAIKIRSCWEPFLENVISSYCDESNLTRLGSKSQIYAGFSLFSATTEESSLLPSPTQIQLINRRKKSKIYAPKAQQCWFFLSKPQENPSIYPCTIDKTFKSYFVQNENIHHATHADCKIGFIIKYKDDLFFHVVTDLNIVGVVENSGKVKDKYSCVLEFEPSEKLNLDQKPDLQSLYPNLAYTDAQALTGQDAQENILDDHVQFLIDYYWKEKERKPTISELKKRMESIVRENDVFEVDLNSGYDTEHQE